MSAIMADVLELALTLTQDERERVAEALLATAGEPDPEDIDDAPSPAPAFRTRAELVRLLTAGAASGPGGEADAAFWAELDAAIREPAAPRRGAMP